LKKFNIFTAKLKNNLFLLDKQQQKKPTDIVGYKLSLNFDNYFKNLFAESTVHWVYFGWCNPGWTTCIDVI
jgi:hypothetical protein